MPWIDKAVATEPPSNMYWEIGGVATVVYPQLR